MKNSFLIIGALIIPSYMHADETPTHKSPLPHASYKKGQAVIVCERDGSWVITKTAEAGSNIYVVDHYSVEAYPSIGYTKRTLVATRVGDLRIFGCPLFTKTITIEDVQGEQPQGKIIAPGGPGHVLGGPAAVDIARPTKGGMAIITILAGGLASVFWKMAARIQELEAERKKK